MMLIPYEDTRLHLPQHIAFIMDGNGRWAQQRGMQRTNGHQAATRNLLEIVCGCAEQGIHYLTLYTFSTENWRRPETEVRGMFDVMTDFLERETITLHHNGIRLQHIGQLDAIDERLQARARAAIDLTANNDRLILTVAFNYGGRADITAAVRKIIERRLESGQIDEQLFTSYLSTAELPDPDLIIRTSGEQRLSNFLLWESAYSTCWTTPVLWPDFRLAHLQEALDAYAASLHNHDRTEDDHFFLDLCPQAA
jgi:undecaprenyl diphosphate synthase